MNHETRLKDKKDVYTRIDLLVKHEGLDYSQRTDLLKVKKSLFHQMKQLDKLVRR